MALTPSPATRMSAAGVEAHRRRAAVFIGGVRLDDEDQVAGVRREVLRIVTEEQALSLYVLLVEGATTFRGWSWPPTAVLADLDRRRLAWTAEDVILLFDLALRSTREGQLPAMRGAAMAAERLDPPGRAACLPRLMAALTAVEDGYHGESPVRIKLCRTLRTLIESADASTRARVRTGVFAPGDGWSRAAVERLHTEAEDVEVVSDLLAHATMLFGPRPSATWVARTGQLLDGRPWLVDLVGELLGLANTCAPAVVDLYGIQIEYRIGPANADLARGLLWVAQVGAAPWLTRVTLELYARQREDKVVNAGFAVLGRRGDAEAIAALVRLRRGTRNRGEQTQIAKAIDEASRTAGLSAGELTEQTVPDAGLDARRERRVTAGGVTATLSLGDDGKVTLAWERDGVRTAKPPADTDADLIRRMKRDVADLRKVVSSERDRLEELPIDDREWPVTTWRQRYRDHPVTGRLVHRLLWTVVDGDRSVVGLPAPGGGFTLVDGTAYEPDDDVRIRPWHPVHADPDDVRAWRDRIMTLELAQPFKQAFREVYLLTPAEEQTGVYSNRFAGHVLRYQQTFALMKERRWATNYLGSWDSGHDGQARREFPSHGLRAVFFHQPATDDSQYTVDFCATDQVRIERRQGRTWTAVPLADVPAVVFSEAMRDVDLFVGVTSIAADPTWADRGEDRFYAYWRDAAFGDLTALGQVRRQVLEHVVPKLRIRDRARLDGNHLVVDGSKHTYRIHVGSGNILMSPNDRYLCIVPAHRTRIPGVRFIPFDGDAMLAVILSKALMLADDHRITDPMILAQIN